MAKQLTFLEVAEAAYAAGFRGTSPGSPLVTAIAIARAESGNVEDKDSPPNSDEWGSVDRGLWQINNHWHPEVSDDCAHSRYCAAGQAFRISDGGKHWSPWTTYRTKAYVPYVVISASAARVLTENGGKAKDGSGFGVGDIPVVGDVVNAGKSVVNVGEAAVKFLGKLTDPVTWIRTGYVILGLMVLLVGIVMLARELGASGAATKVSKLPGAGKLLTLAAGAKKVTKGAGEAAKEGAKEGAKTGGKVAEAAGKAKG